MYDGDASPREVGGNGADLTRIIKAGAFENLDGWNNIDIILDGNRVTQIVNGRVVNIAWNIRQPDPANPAKMLPLKRGHIALQEEGSEIWFRNVKVRALKPSEKFVDWRTTIPTTP